jgi:hypothetical protein
MALKKTVVTPQGFEAIDAYIVCESLRVVSKKELDLQLNYYKEKGLLSFYSVYHVAPYNIDGPNPFQQAYEYLKTLPEFLDSADC